MSKPVTIMLVDDDEEDRMIFRDAAMEVNPADTVYFAEGGMEMLDGLKHYRTQNKLPALIVLDLNMPRINGIETLKMLKNNPEYQHIPVIILSTSVNEVQEAECMRLGAVHYLTKAATYGESIRIASFIGDYARNGDKHKKN